MPTELNPPPSPAAAERPGEREDAARMSFGDHLDELRSCLILALVGVGVASAITLFFGRQILILICRPLWTVQFANGLQPSLQALSPTAAFSAYLRIAFLAGLIVSMPWVLHQFWRFVAAGLYVHERRFVKRLLPVSMGLFAIGVVFLYFVVLPIVLNFFIWFNRAFELHDLAPTGFQSLLLSDEVATPATSLNATPLAVPILDKNPEHPEPGFMWFNAATRRLMVQGPDGILSAPFTSGESAPAMQSQFAIDFYISFVLMLALAFGIAFETPLVVFFLAWSGILTRDRMARARRYVLLLVVVVAAVLTPPDPTSQLLLAIPMYLLFELGLWAARFVEGKYPTESAG